MAEAEEKPISNSEECGECASSIFWAVFLTLMVVFAAMLIVYFFWKYYWRIKHGKHLVLVTDVEKGEPEFAFDNPGFREGTPVIQAKKVSAEIKEKAELKDNSQKLSNGHKPQSLEDGALNKSGASTSTSTDQKTNVIPLKSKDFTGLGFDICGNMRDGIYVKDLLHRGPASETGMIKQGDRISAIRINFSHMVYEDAKAILSYASPYEVEIEVEDGSMTANAAKSSSPNSTHSFYRSQSFSTAQQIQKIIPRKLNFNSTDKKPDQPADTKPAILEVSEISDKMFKYGVKVLPDIKSKVLSQSTPPVTTSETQQHANISATVIDIQSDSGIDTKTPTTSFDEVDLSPPVSQSHQHEKPTSTSTSLTSTFKDTNMKTKLVKGIQNLKDKLNNHIQKSTPKESSEMQKIEKTSEQQSASSSPKPNSSVSTVESVDQNHKPQEDINLRLRSSSISSNEDSAKKSKRKAPPPPVVLPDVEFNLLNEIENEVNKNNYECKDSDSEAEPDMNTIELNSSHITVHHIPEESSRKAASLGDLSKITETDSPVPLERAVSLELTEHTPRGSKKRKAPLPPEENLSNEELFAKDSKSDLGVSKLKKSSLFGTLEEAVKTKDDDSIGSDSDMLTSSTPMKLPDDDNKFLSIESNCSNISWELNFDLQDDSNNVFADIDEKVPDLPTSPMPNPNLPTYVTEIKVSNGDHDHDLSQVNISDLTLFVTAAEINENDKTTEEADDSKTLELIETKTMIDTSPSSTDSTSTNDYENEDSSLDTVKEMSYTNGIGGEDHSPKDSPVESSKTNQKSFSKFSKENMSDEQILALNSSSTPNLKKSKIKSPSSTNKVPKLSQSVSPVKAAGSRIPIRANTEPSLKVSLINKDDIVVPKPRKYKLSEDASLENGKPVTFASSNHLPSPTHKTSVLSETRHNGPNR